MIPQLDKRDLDLVRSTAIFGGLGDEAFRSLLVEAAVRPMSRGEALFVQGDPVTAFYVVLDGWVKIYRLTPSGEEAVVAVFTRGQSFAEAAAFTAGRYPASGQAVTEGRVLSISNAKLLQRIKQSPDIGLAMLASTSIQLHMLVQQIEQLKAHTGAQRVAEFLASLCPVHQGACTIGLPYDKALIAGRLGMKPESLSRAFARLRSLGVRVEQSTAAISDVARLREFADEEPGRGELSQQ